MREECGYLEVGKNNVWSEARMAAAAACSPFHLIAADYQSALWTHMTLSELTERVSLSKVRGWRTRALAQREITTPALPHLPTHRFPPTYP